MFLFLWIFLRLQHLVFAGIGVAVFPIGRVPGLIKVFPGGNKILVDPGIVRVSDPVFGADLANGRGDVGIPSRTHSGKQVVFDLKVEASRQASRNEASISR